MKWVTMVILNSKLARIPSRDLKDFAAQFPKQSRISFRKLGMAAVPIEKIVGSVGRAHDLDKRFRYRGRAITERYQQATVNMEKGEPRQPIKVYKLKRLRARRSSPAGGSHSTGIRRSKRIRYRGANP